MTLKRTHARPAVALLLATWCGTLCAAPSAQAGMFSLSEREEIEAGQKVARDAEREYGGVLPPNDPRSVRVRALGSRFAQLSERKNIPYTFKVLNNDKVLNAFAAPGGPIYVTKKLVDVTANDAELAYVLGHETAHIDRKHIVKTVEKQSKVGLAVGVLGAILGRGKAGDVIGAATNITYTLWSRGYSRDHEHESDVVGVRWMSQLGFDPRASMTMLAKLGGGGGGLDKYLSTHPAPRDRQANMQQLIQKENLLDVARRSGGPHLWAQGNYGGYNPASVPQNYPGYPGTQPSYPSSSYPTNNPPASYPPSNYPPAGNYPAGGATAGELNLGAPLLLANRPGGGQVILAPVAGMARWAGASARSNGNVVVLQRGQRTLELRRYSTVAYLNGRAEQMSAAPNVYDGVFYAPLGILADGVGAQAAFDSQNRLVRLSLNGNTGFVRVP